MTSLSWQVGSCAGREANTSEKGQQNDASSEEAAQKAAHSTPKTPPEDPDLAELVKAWPVLPPALKAGILAMVKAAKGGGAG